MLIFFSKLTDSKIACQYTIKESTEKKEGFIPILFILILLKL